MTRHAAITGVGMTTTTSPSRQTRSKIELCQEALERALRQAGRKRADVDAVVFGSIDGFESVVTSGKMVVPHLGLRPGVPVYVIHTGGTTGGNILNLAASLVRSGAANLAVCIGPNTFDGATDMQAVVNTASPVAMEEKLGMGAVHMGAFFLAAYQDRYGVSDEVFMEVSNKHREQAASNPYAHVRVPMDASIAGGEVSTPLRFGMVCPVSSGATAVLVGAEDEVTAGRPVVRVAAYGAVSDGYLGGSKGRYDSFEPLAILAERVYRDAGIMSPRDELDVLEIFSPYAPMELVLLEDLQICGRGEAPALLKSGATRFGGDLPVNVSGGVHSTNPGVAAQIAPVAYVALQLMGEAPGGKQVKNARRGLAHSTGGAYFQFHTLTILEAR